MVNFKLFLSILILVLLSGCAAPAKVEQMTVLKTENVVFAPNYNKNFVVIEVKGGKIQSSGGSSKIEDQAFKSALMNSLSSFNLLDFDARYQIKAKINNVSDPLLGLNFDVTMQVQYSVVDKTSDELIYDELIDSTGSATVSESLIAIDRLRMAKERAAKDNIRKFLTGLSRI